MIFLLSNIVVFFTVQPKCFDLAASFLHDLIGNLTQRCIGVRKGGSQHKRQAHAADGDRVL